MGLAMNNGATGSRRRSWFLLVEIAGSMAAIAWVVIQIEWVHLLGQVGGLHPGLLLLSYVVFSLRLGPCAARWSRVSRACSYDLPFRVTLYGYMIGGFFNAFLPTGKGGDLARAIFIGRRYRISTAGLMGTILVERLAGLTVALLSVIMMLPWIISDHAVLWEVLISSLILAGMGLAAFGLCHVPRLQQMSRRITDRWGVGRLRAMIDELLGSLAICGRNLPCMAATLGWSICNQLILIGTAYILGLAIPALQVPWYSFLLVIPLSFFSELLPSIGGYGVREAGIVVFLGWFGAGAEAATLFALLQLTFYLTYSAFGGIVFLLTRQQNPLSNNPNGAE